METLILIQRDDWINEVVEWEVNVKKILILPELVDEVRLLTNEQIDTIFEEWLWSYII